MSFLKRLLGGLGVPMGHAEWRRFQMPFVPEPGNLDRLADHIVETIQGIEGVTLDYTPESLKEVDRLLLGLREDGLRVRHIADPILCFGCYVGEIMRRRLGATWVAPPSPMLGMFPVVLIGSDNYSAPISKVYKHVMNGSEDSVYFFYRMMERDVPQAEHTERPSPLDSVATPPNNSA